MTENLKEIYSNHEDYRMFYDAIELHHPNFTTTHRLIRADNDMSFNGHTFMAFPFNIVMPEVGADQQDITLVLDNVSQELINEMESAITSPHIPIQMTYYVFVDGDTTSQITPIVLHITNISANAFTITALVTRSDLYNRRFPFGEKSYFDERFVGLYL